MTEKKLTLLDKWEFEDAIIADRSLLHPATGRRVLGVPAVAHVILRFVSTQTGTGWTTYGVLARETGLSRSNVISAVAALVASGWFQKRTSRNAAQDNAPNQYVVNLEKLDDFRTSRRTGQTRSQYASDDGEEIEFRAGPYLELTKRRCDELRSALGDNYQRLLNRLFEKKQILTTDNVDAILQFEIDDLIAPF